MAMISVLLIHGFPFDHSMWRHQLHGLSNWRCIAPDLPGFGNTPGPSPDDCTVTVYAQKLIEQMDAMSIQKSVVCGLSMGGYIAFELLRRYPERVSGAILCNTKSQADTDQAKRDRVEMATLAQKKGTGAVAEQLLPKLLSKKTLDRKPELVREVREMMKLVPVRTIVGALHALRERPDSTPLLGQIRVPVLVLAGTDDQIAPAPGMREMASAIPGAQFVEIAEAGHVTPLEQPDEVTEAIRGFLNRLS